MGKDVDIEYRKRGVHKTVKGYQRKIVCVKNTDSPIIEEAYFILYKDVSLEGGRRSDFIKEADRIIEEGTKKRRTDGRAFAFLLGALSALAVATSAFLIIRMLLP